MTNIKRLLTMACLLLGAVMVMGAQNIAAQYQNVSVTPLKGTAGDVQKLKIQFDIILNQANIKSNEMIEFIPVISSTKGPQTSEKLASVYVAGSKRYKWLKRTVALNTAKAISKDPSSFHLRKNKTDQVVTYKTIIPYQEWMKNANLTIGQELTGCAACKVAYADNTLMGKLFKDPYKPVFTTEYIHPEVEAVKMRAEKQEARFNYKQGRSELLKDFGNNASELQRVNDFINSFVGDPNVKVSDYEIAGYASPEGNFNSNINLSKARANTFATYLTSTYKIPSSKMKVSWFGEDWDGLKEAVKNSTLENKAQIISIIDENSTDVKREKLIHALDGGKTYNNLLQNFYPPLRRNVYSVSYVVKSFDLDEALKVYRTKPNQLSLEEFFRIANTFPKDSEEYVKVFNVAIGYFPSDPVANLNTGAALLEKGLAKEALPYLLKAGSSQQALNNLAIAYTLLGEVDKAESQFRAAAHSGSKVAEKNLKEFLKYKEDLL